MDEPSEFQGSNSTIAVRWRAIDMESKITEYRWAVGTSKGSNDIREFDTIIPMDEKDVLAVAEDLEGLLEEGSIYYVTVVALNLAGLEETVYTNGVTVLMTEPNTTSANISVPGAVQIAPNVVSTEDQTSISFVWTAVEDSGINAYCLRPGEKIVCSPLSKQDVVQEYTSDASARFKPIIVNPYLTADFTDRNLRHRIRRFTDQSFVLSPVAGQELRGPLNITVTMVNVTAAPTELLRLLFWNAESEMWQDAGHTCQLFTQTYTYKNTSEFNVQVCNTSNLLTNPTSVHRDKRSPQEGIFFGKETFFVVALVDSSFQNSAPRLAVSPYLWTYEDVPIVAYLEAIDDDDDEVTFSIDRSTETLFIGEVEIEPNGILRYTPCKDCFGKDFVTVVMSENRRDGETPLVTRETVVIDVVALEDNPDVFAVKDRVKVNSTGDSITVTLEENTAQRLTRSKYDVLVFGADIETNDVLSLVFHDPSNGTLALSKIVQNITFLHDDTDDHATVDGANFANKSADEVSIPYPQNLLMPHRPEKYSWVAVGFTYVPDMNFYGHDQVRVYAHDQSGKRSDVLTFNIFVLENRCMNGGLCTGPDHDPNCTDIQRSVSFSGYECACLDGYYGRYCESDFDECSSNPCPQNYTCVDLPNDFLCDCGSPSWPCASQSMPPWQIALITLLCIGVTIAVVAWAVWKASKKEKNKIG
ncbi:PREDICTED: uncharacterized protein LOC109465079 [Branchiostoma belcheri]|uniref:Uncharacterized protein LOC109465079 n=1 Tax=Branchiostoma belcheri TaxID=7741 RepID=A0A6P4XMC8_BRABE|nr:PREDICTED: uncharacterized protein LOC109465079 [Branchiostoma belcheri]